MSSGGSKIAALRIAGSSSAAYSQMIAPELTPKTDCAPVFARTAAMSSTSVRTV